MVHLDMMYCKPDAYGRWSAHGREIEFFLEYDFGTEALDKLAGKLHDYAALAAASGITTPLLIWPPTAFREATTRQIQQLAGAAAYVKACHDQFHSSGHPPAAQPAPYDLRIPVSPALFNAR